MLSFFLLINPALQEKATKARTLMTIISSTKCLYQKEAVFPLTTHRLCKKSFDKDSQRSQLIGSEKRATIAAKGLGCVAKTCFLCSIDVIPPLNWVYEVLCFLPLASIPPSNEDLDLFQFRFALSTNHIYKDHRLCVAKSDQSCLPFKTFLPLFNCPL